MDTQLPPPAVLYQLATGHYVSHAIYAAAKLGIADLLGTGPQRCDDLAKATGTHAPALRRVLRLLASAGVFAETEDGRFELTPVGSCLQSGPGSFRPVALLFTSPGVRAAWGDLLHSVRTGEPALSHVFGVGSFEYFAQHPEEAAVFDEAMGAFTAMVAIAVAAAYDFSRFGTIIDVGGGEGALLAGILRANPALRGVVFDMPRVAEGANETIAAAGLGDRCEFVGGDFFEAVPGGGDAYILKHVIHDWDDALGQDSPELSPCDEGGGQAADRRGRIPGTDRPVRCEPRRCGERREHAGVHRWPPAGGGRVPGAVRRGRVRADADRPDAGDVERDRRGARIAKDQ